MAGLPTVDVVLVPVDEITEWVRGLDGVMARVAPRFGRVEPRRRARGYLVGLLAPSLPG
jgi:hypothetical protein